ncbi:MAG: PH domain-containing protein [Christensenellales bacterium]|jgi:uncharacterized membrane protein YdbT with pleckstrin-like domain
MSRNLLEQETQELWSDRKRILGMPITFTRYSVEDDRLLSKVGLLKTEVNEILLYRILDIKLVKTLRQKLFGVGTITLFTADSNQPTYELKNIKHPDEVRRFLSKIIEKCREEKRVQGREMFGVASSAAATSRPYVDIDGDGVPDIPD